MLVLIKILRDSRPQYSSLEHNKDELARIKNQINELLIKHSFIVEENEVVYAEATFLADDNNRDKIIVEVSMLENSIKSQLPQELIINHIKEIVKKRTTLYPQTEPSIFFYGYKCAI